MTTENGWSSLAGGIACATEHLEVHIDTVKRPDGRIGQYDWVATKDQVRVAAIYEDRIVLIRQHHYLLGEMLQLPGGAVENAEPPEEAAKRELAEETGLSHGRWSKYGEVAPLPGLSPAKVHLWIAHDLDSGRQDLDDSEADVRVRLIPTTGAVELVESGQVRCAASAVLLLGVAGRWP